MNLLFATINNPFGSGPYGGAESSIRLLAGRMSDRGHTVIYVTTMRSPLDEKLAAAEGIKLFFFPKVDWQKYWIPRRIDRRLEHLVWKLTLGVLARRHKVDILYTFYELKVLEAAIGIPQWLAKPKVIMRMAGLRWHVDSSKNSSLKERYKRAFKSVDSVNYIENGFVPLAESKLEELHFHKTFNHSFVQDIGSSTPAKRNMPYQSVSSSPFRILMVARFSGYQKRQDLLIEAIARLPCKLKIEATFVGEGSNREEMRALAQKLGAADRVKFADFMKQKELWELMENSHLLCHAADFEGLGKSVVEAMHKGLPVLASNVAPLNCYIRDAENGFLVDNEPGAWASRIESLALAPEILAKTSEASLLYVRKRWDPQVCANAFEARFAEIAARQIVRHTNT